MTRPLARDARRRFHASGFVALFVLIFPPASTGAAAAQDSTLTRVLAAHATTFELAGGRLSGPGADTLAALARENQFLLVGEVPHGVRELPEFVAALFEVARPAGYRHLAVEAGPITARMLEAMSRKPDARAELTSLLAQHTPFSLPFFNWREEADMLVSVVGSVGRGHDVLWGLDQEFILSPTLHFERLAELARTQGARAIATRYARASADADRRLISDRNPAAVWMVSVPDDSLERLIAAFASPRSVEADAILRELAESRAIYHLYFEQQNYESNLRRTDLMKRHFSSAFAAARSGGEASPRAVIKLGANHVFRGPSTTETYEIGSFVPELAIGMGGRSFSMLVMVAGGTVNAYRPFGSALPDTAQAYDPTGDAEVSFTDARAILAAASRSQWTLFDLRPMRAALQDGKLPGVGEKLKRTLLSFDGIVIVPGGHASSLLLPP